MKETIDFEPRIVENDRQEDKFIAGNSARCYHTQENCKVERNKMNRQGRQERQEANPTKNRYPQVFLGALGVLGGSKS